MHGRSQEVSNRLFLTDYICHDFFYLHVLPMVWFVESTQTETYM